MQKPTSSTRPFDTTAPLGVNLGMMPVMGERTGQHGDRVFDATFYKDDKKVMS